jgi:V/A-type H+/Na+-transporting ATPase subunit C
MAVKRPADERAGAGIEVPSEFLYARLHGRRTMLYEGERLLALADATDVPDLAYRIYPHAEIADQFELELQIQNACVEELAFVGRYAGGPQRALYDALMRRYVVEDLKVLLRQFRQEAGRSQQAALIRLPRRYSLPVEELADSGNIEEFIGRIPDYALRRGAMDALPLYSSTGRKAFLEMGLDRGCWQAVGAALRALPADEREDCQAPVRREFDSVRFTAVLRASRVYGLSWEQFQAVVPTGWGRLSSSMMRSLFEGAGQPEALRIMESIAPGSRNHLRPEGEGDITALEDALWRSTARLARHRFGASESGFGLLVAYFYLKQDETRHLMSLTQMVRRGMASEEIVSYLQR